MDKLFRFVYIGESFVELLTTYQNIFTYSQIYATYPQSYPQKLGDFTQATPCGFLGKGREFFTFPHSLQLILLKYCM